MSKKRRKYSIKAVYKDRAVPTFISEGTLEEVVKKADEVIEDEQAIGFYISKVYE